MNEKEIFAARPLNEERNQFVIVVGNHLASKQVFESKEKAEKYMETPKWEMIFALIAEMIQISNTQEFKEKNKED